MWSIKHVEELQNATEIKEKQQQHQAAFLYSEFHF